MPTSVSAAKQCLTEEAARALDEAVAVARRRSHAQTTSLHAVSALLALPSSLLREACARARSSTYSPRLQFRALELSVGVSLNRLPSSKSVEEPPVSNSLMAAIKRSQANQRLHPDNFHYQIIQSQTQQQQQTTSLVTVELKHFILSILDDPIVSRVFGEAGFRSTDIKLSIIHPPVSRFARTRCPTVFLCNLTDPDLTQRRSSFGFPGMEDENWRRIAEVLVRKSGKRNPLLLGVCAMDALRSFTERVKSGGENVLPSELSGVSVICIGNEISEFVNGGGSEEKMGLKLKDVGELQCLDERGGKVVVNFGDLKALVEDNDDSSEGGVSFVVSRLSQLVELHGEGLWLMGAAASYETYSKFLGKFPSIEKDWDLNLLPITSSNKPSGDVFPYKSSYPTSFTKMGYIWNLVKGDIKRLTFLFSALSEIFGKCDELRKKLVELKDLLTILAEMVGNSEKQYKVDDEEKQDEGSVLDDEEKQHERSVLELKKHERIVLELWLEELQDAVFNMEDLVDKIHTEALRHKLDGQICEKMEDIRCSLESYVKQGDVLGLAGLRYNLECLLNLQGMHHLDKYLLDLNNRMGSFNDSDDWVVSLWERRLDPTDYIYFVDESEVFGMDCDKEEIIKLLLSDDASDRQLSVISIEGNGRIGKTTLARLVYNEQRVTHHFHLKAWVRVPFDFDWVTRSILKFLTLQGMDIKVPNSLYYYLNDLDKLNSDELGHRLQQCLKGKRFLLVLDGAKWTPNSKRWEALRFALKDAANGSCIIVTTRNKDIAPMMDAVSTFRMEPLSEEKCWPIFAKFAFGDQNPSSDTRLEVIGKEIVQMCHGLPSSVRILGSLLRFKLQQEKWEAILQRLKPSSDSREDSRENVNVVPNLKLPEDLKLCLAYCSIFPQDYEIEKEKLVLLCMAEGFLKPAPIGKTLKEDSENIDKLKSFFPKSSRNESSFRMCMNNLAAYVSTRYCFRLEDNHPSQIPLNTRYLSLVGGKYENSVIFEAIDRAKLLRTFLPLDHESRHLCATELQNLLSKVQFLRVLSLSHYHITEIPDSIGNLEHLRYIDLSHTPIKRLPESVCVLCNLLSLILSNCHSLTELPENTSNLVNLLNLDISGSGLSEMPIGISNLKNLRFLPCFVVGKKSGSLIELKNITRLEGTLHISKLQNVTSENDAGGTPLVGMHFLEELVLDWDDNTADPENARKVLAALKPYPTLERLTINFYCGPKFPKWLDGTETFNEMVFLRLSNCKNCSTLPPLGNLPYLRVLIIECMDAVEEVGPDFSAETSTRKNTEFKSLERLTFEGMSKWTKWVPLDELPCLNQLCIRRCPKLRGNLPNLLPSVERVEISESQELVTALTTEESLKNLRYRDRIVSISSDGKETYFKSERATGSSSLIIEGEDIEKLKETDVSEETDVEIQNPFEFPFLEEISSLPLPQRTAECSLLVTPGEDIEKLKETDVSEETDVEIQNPFEFPFLEEISSLPLPQRTAECSLLVTPGKVTEEPKEIEERGETKEETDVEIQTTSRIIEAHLTNSWSSRDEIQDLSSFKSMKVSEISELMEVAGLHSLKIEECDALEFIPEEVMDGNPSLQHLYIINCCSLKSFPQGHSLTALKILYIQNCKKLEFLTPAKREHQFALEHLCIGSSCDSMIVLPLHLFRNLISLSIWNCANLESLTITEGIQEKLTFLEALEIRDCPKLVSFPKGGFPTPNLSSIWISNCKILVKLPDQLHTLGSLRSMFINNCPELVSLPEGGLPFMLSLLCVTSCEKLNLGSEWGLHKLKYLRQLEIEGGCKNVKSFTEDNILLPCNLSSLRISGLSNLRDLNGLQHLTALKTLEISCCNKLQSLPEEDLPSSLSSLCIKDCSLLIPKHPNKRKRLV